jgi:hypothetical protein
MERKQNKTVATELALPQGSDKGVAKKTVLQNSLEECQRLQSQISQNVSERVPKHHSKYHRVSSLESDVCNLTMFSH